jgi:hypothetical protein
MRPISDGTAVRSPPRKLRLTSDDNKPTSEGSLLTLLSTRSKRRSRLKRPISDGTVPSTSVAPMLRISSEDKSPNSLGSVPVSFTGRLKRFKKSVVRAARRPISLGIVPIKSTP